MEWSNEKVQLFIELYEEEPAIWNPKDPGHKNRNNVHDAWARIKTKFCEGRISVEELKKKKDNLMATYRKLNAKVKSSATSGSGTNEVFKPNWPFYEQMAKFLHGVYKPTTTISSEDTVDPDVELNEEEVVIHEDNVVDRENESSTNTDTMNSVIFKKPTNANNKKDVNQRRKVEHQIEQAYEVLKKISAEPEPVEDECTLYTKLLCAKLKSMDTLTRDIAMHEIDNTMFRLKQQQAFPRFQSPPNQPYAGFHLPQNPIASSYDQNMQSSLSYQTSPYQPSPQSHSQWRPIFQPSSQSHSQRRANFQSSPQSHSQQSADFQPSPHSNSQQSSDMEEYSHSQPFSGFESLSKEQSIEQLYADAVSKLLEKSE